MEALKASHRRTAAWLVSLLLLWLAAPYLQRLDSQFADHLGRLNNAPPAQEVVLIDLDESSLAMFGPWPWPRPLMAQLADRLAAVGASKQIWDVSFSTPRAGDEVLEAALIRHGMTIGVVPVIDPAVEQPPTLGLGGGISYSTALCGPGSPFPAARGRLGLSESLAGGLSGIGHLTPKLDGDGRLRKLPAVICDNGQPIFTLALAGFLERPVDAVLEKGWAPWQAPWQLVIGELRIPLDAEGSIPLQFGTALDAYTVYPVQYVLSNEMVQASLAGKTVLLGATALGIGDRIATVLSPNTPGVAVHAELYNRLSSQRFVTQPANPALMSLVLVVLATLPSLFAYSRRFFAALIGGNVLLVLLLLYMGYLISPMVVFCGHMLVALADFLLRYDEEKRVRHQHESRLSALLPGPLLAQLKNSDPNDLVAAHRVRVGILHARIRNFDRFVVQAPPEITLATMHALAHLAQDVAEKHGAEIYPGENSDYLIVWSEPDSRDAGQRMLDAARTLHREATSLLTPLPANPPLALAASLHADEVLEGFIGRRDRRRPVLYGPALHIAQQLQPLTEELAAPLLFTQNIAQYLPDAEKRLLGSFKLADIRSPIDLYCAPGTVDPIEALRLVA